MTGDTLRERRMSETVHEASREVPVLHEVDVVVIGGSCTGVFAAVRAARLGMRVAIIEKQNCFGGTATAGNVNIWHRLHDTEGREQIIAGLTAEVIARLSRRDAVLRGKEPSRNSYRLNTEELKIELDELVTESGVQPLLHTVYVAPVGEDRRLNAVIVENKSGRGAIRARQFVDASGDGDLARHLGLPFSREEGLQPPTTCARLRGLEELGGFDWQAAVREHGAEFGLPPDWGWGGPFPGMPGVQLRADNHIFDTDASDAAQLTRAEIDGRRQVRALMDAIRKYAPQGSSIALSDLAATLGIRETARVRARYRLSGEDVLSGRRFEDAVANGSYPVDTHHSDGPGITWRFLDGTEVTVAGRGLPEEQGRWREELPENPTFYQVPFRCLTPGQVPNLVLAGRMLDADREAFSAVRVMVNLNQTGEAAGVAAALAVEGGGDVADVEAAKLRATLERGGSIVL